MMQSLIAIKSVITKYYSSIEVLSHTQNNQLVWHYWVLMKVASDKDEFMGMEKVSQMVTEKIPLTLLSYFIFTSGWVSN